MNPQDRLKQYMKNEEMPTPINYNNPDFLGGDTPITSHDLRQALIAGYKQALEDMRNQWEKILDEETTYFMDDVVDITDDRQMNIRVHKKRVIQRFSEILTIPEEETK